jgi:hypothetical protein
MKTPYSTNFYEALVGHACASWDHAQEHANEIVRATGVKCEPSYDGMRKHAGQKACVRFHIDDMSIRDFRRFRKIAARRGWKVTIYGYWQENRPTEFTDEQIETVLGLRNQDVKPAGKLSRILGVLRS